MFVARNLGSQEEIYSVALSGHLLMTYFTGQEEGRGVMTQIWKRNLHNKKAFQQDAYREGVWCHFVCPIFFPGERSGSREGGLVPRGKPHPYRQTNTRKNTTLSETSFVGGKYQWLPVGWHGPGVSDILSSPAVSLEYWAANRNSKMRPKYPGSRLAMAVCHSLSCPSYRISSTLLTESGVYL